MIFALSCQYEYSRVHLWRGALMSRVLFDKLLWRVNHCFVIVLREMYFYKDGRRCLWL